MKRRKMKKRTSRRLFTKTAMRTNRKNVAAPRRMRGGYRL
jgi:hypothetical protein